MQMLQYRALLVVIYFNPGWFSRPTPRLERDVKGLVCRDLGVLAWSCIT
jgi:hypothetical protein